MRLPALCIVVTTIALAAGRHAEAEENRGDSRAVVVYLEHTATTLKGRLVSLDADRVTLIVKGHRTTLPLGRVVRITARRGDSLENGAIIGAVIGGLLCARNCGQGLGSASQLPLAVASSAAVWGLAGAGIDALHRREDVLYERVPAP